MHRDLIMEKVFKPKFKGYMKMFLHDDCLEFLPYRTTFTGAWVKSRRHKVVKNHRVYSIRLYIIDMDGDKVGHTVFELSTAGGYEDISSAIFNQGNIFCDALRSERPHLKIDLINSYAVIRA